MKGSDLKLETDLLLEGIYRKYGHDFRNYARAHVGRRVEHRLRLLEMESPLELLHRIIRDEDAFNDLLLDLSINITEMFRDPLFYKALREQVVPYLKTYPFLKLWHAGCSAGQEVYSMAILLEEESMMSRSQIYATDFNEKILGRARDGIYPAEQMRQYTRNYQNAGGLASFADYYNADYEHVIIKPFLRENILFSYHNLATDGVFGEMHIIFCRNVMIYFNQELQNRVLRLFHDSLVPGGFLCLGSKESIRFSEASDLFEAVVPGQKIYRKKR